MAVPLKSLKALWKNSEGKEFATHRFAKVLSLVPHWVYRWKVSRVLLKCSLLISLRWASIKLSTILQSFIIAGDKMQMSWFECQQVQELVQGHFIVKATKHG